MTQNRPNPSEPQPVNRQTRRWAVAIMIAISIAVIAVFIHSANPGDWEAWGTGPGSSYYNLLVQGFAKGQLSLNREAPPGLQQLADPYDPSANEPYRWIDGAPLDEVSYYHGKLYLYFGITPALVLFGPYSAFTGHYISHRDATVIFFSIGFLASVALLYAIWRRYFSQTSLDVLAAGILALGLANLIPAIVPRSDVWEVAVSCGYALMMLALAGIWAATHHARRRELWLAAASLAYGLAVGARPFLLFGALILFLPVIQAWREKQRVIPSLLAAIIPITLVGAGLMLYNVQRFGNPLEFGQHYQLVPTRQDTTMNQFSLRYVWFNFRVGFLAPAHWTTAFPFVRDIAVPPLPEHAKVEHPFGILTNIPLVWLALALPLTRQRKSASESFIWRGFLAAVTLLFATCTLTILFHNSMCLRYEVEFTSTLVLLAVIGIFALECALADQPVRLRMARCVWGILLAFSVMFNLLAGMDRQAEAHDKLGFIALRQGRTDEAIAQVREALNYKNDAETHLQLAKIFLQLKRYDDAVSEYKAALKVEPRNATALNNLGTTLLQGGKPTDALGYLERLVQVQPQSAEAIYNLGNCLLQLGRLREAGICFAKSLQVEPNSANARNNLGSVYLQLGKPDDALAQFQKAVELQPDFAGAQHNLAAAYAAKGQFSQAIPIAQRALQLAQAQSNKALVNSLMAELKSYQAPH